MPIEVPVLSQYLTYNVETETTRIVVSVRVLIVDIG